MCSIYLSAVKYVPECLVIIKFPFNKSTTNMFTEWKVDYCAAEHAFFCEYPTFENVIHKRYTFLVSYSHGKMIGSIFLVDYSHGKMIVSIFLVDYSHGKMIGSIFLVNYSHEKMVGSIFLINYSHGKMVGSIFLVD